MAGSALQGALALILAAVCCVVLQGCGGGGGTPPSPPPPPPTPPSPPSPARKWSEVVTVPGWPKNIPFLSFAIKAGNMVYASGMQGFDMKTMELVPGGAQAETTQTLKNLQELLEAANTTMQNVVLCSVSLAKIADFEDVNKAYKEFWPNAPPARVAVQVAALAGNASVEIQCNAVAQGAARSDIKIPGFPDPVAKGIPLSYAVKTKDMVYISGMQGMDKTGKLVSGGIVAEVGQALANLAPILTAAGSDYNHLVSCSISLTDINAYDQMNKRYTEYMKSLKVSSLPARVAVQVGALAGKGCFEIQCTASTKDIPEPEVVQVPGWPTVGPFAMAIKAGGIAYVSGNQGRDMNTSHLVDGGAGPETTKSLSNIQEILKAAGSGLEDVVACELSLRSLADFKDVNKAYTEFWPHDPPSRVAVQVGDLPGKASVEIRCAAGLAPKSAEAMVV
eukprot:TRINITY_DN46469_c0_g1_i1.p1 TRINITY_DN46469_c0_g1~~TRINITY_DN46469_c0_g1_i1.p1  ORF type:complete len:449 (-),score=100.82 TRINITY_DN46469_c0_g1_i1:146-1492(-)